jgi:indole-3-glycerol phosphate synthase
MAGHTLRTETILDDLVNGKRAALKRRQRVEPLAAVVAKATAAPEPVPFVPSLLRDEIRLIAEIKRASPTAGLLEPDFDPVARANAYVDGGAAAISILTEEDRFLGKLDDLSAVRDALAPGRRPPLLRKDFLFSPYQIYETRAAGADAVLLIVAMLDQAMLRDLLRLAEELSLATLVEVHDEGEAARALSAGARVVGINNRDLHTFQTSLAVTERVRPELPPDCLVVSESGIRRREDVQRLADAGVDAILVGEALMRSGSVASAVRQLSTVPKPAVVCQRSHGRAG